MELNQIINLDWNYYAHKSEDKNRKKETLSEHTNLCIKYRDKIIKAKSLDGILNNFIHFYMGNASEKAVEFAYAAILSVIDFHDTGKINPAFQRNRMDNPLNCPDFICLSGSHHSLFSAVIYLDWFYSFLDKQKVSLKEKGKLKALLYLNSYIISKHHSDLDSMGEYYKSFAEGGAAAIIVDFFNQSKQDTKQSLYRGPFFFRDEQAGKFSELSKIWNEVSRKLTRSQRVVMYGYSRLLYSLLVSSDYYATSEYMNGIEIEDFGTIDEKEDLINAYSEYELVKNIRNYEKSGTVSGNSDINRLRMDLFLEAERSWRKQKEEFIYFLEAPTGSGKSNTAVNISLQMLKEGMDDIIYVYPFNTLVEQNKKTLSEMLDGKEELLSKVTVLNSITPIPIDKAAKEQEMKEEDSGNYYRTALLDRQFLNYPFILTTHISFFETLFGCERESVFGFLHLANSVIVMDEIQSYKNTIWSEIIIFLKEMAKLLHMKIIIMSATLPDLDFLTQEESSVVRLIKEREKYFSDPLFKDRVTVSYELLEEKIKLEELAEHILNQDYKSKKIVVEFIKKDSAYTFYEMLCEKADVCAELITGDDNQADRSIRLKHISSSETGMILAATQVIEAGVDIDMDIGYKDISKLDSEEQFMGRINRSCKRSGTVYFFDMDSAEKIYRGDIRINSEFTLKNNEMRGILKQKNFKEYYNPVLKVLKQQWNDSCDENSLDEFFDNEVRYLNFQKIENRLKLIEEKDDKISVFLARTITLEDGSIVDGQECWQQYKELLTCQDMDYSEKKVKLSNVKSKLNYFIYEISKKTDFIYHDRVGEIYCIFDGDCYFENGKLKRELFEQKSDFIS